MKNRRCIVTGGCGFIGSALVRHLCREGRDVLVVDKLTYAGCRDSLKEAEGRYSFLQADICDLPAMERAFAQFRPDTVFHLAAESHVDRSIDNPGEFVRTNVDGTVSLLTASRKWHQSNPKFTFQHISTDEVYGSLGKEGFFTETSPYAPHSPYSASKAASDHFVRAWRDTYALPVLITNCSNNYGPYHFPEKLIPLIILNCLESKPLPVYGDGANVRDWLYVEDHVKALCLVNELGENGETYNVGGHNERTNLEVVTAVASILDEMRPRPDGSYRDLITFVKDRPGHDLRYAIDPSKLVNSLGWKPEESFDSGIAKTVKWYLENEWWWRPIREGRYSGGRLGQV